MARKWEKKFLAALEESANVSTAAEAAGTTRQNAYAYRRSDETFAALWEQALDVGVGTLEDEAVRRARDGVDEPIYQRGELVGTVKKYSDTLLIFLLKSHKPVVYAPPQRVQSEVSGKDGGAIKTEVDVKFGAEKFDDYINRLIAVKSAEADTGGSSIG